MLNLRRFATYACFLSVLGAVEKDTLTDRDRAEIGQAIQRSRHAAVPDGGGYAARSYSQEWLTRFDGRGFTVQPNAGGWTWGLELQRYGFAGSMQTATAVKSVSTDKERVRYHRGEMEEWFINESRGLEHGFTLASRPAGASGKLQLVLGVRGGLAALTTADGRSVSFRNAAGQAVLMYAGLKVWDAAGKVLPAHFEPQAEAGTLRLAIDEAGARYPLTIDPWIQQAYLKASNADNGAAFGTAVSASGNTVVIGAPDEDSNALGINGTSTGTINNSGAAYVFVRSGSTWTQQAYLKTENPNSNDAFGSSVTISGDTIAVGAPNEDSNAVGVNNIGFNNSSSNSGAVYVFVRNGVNWSQQGYVKASNTGSGDNFGRAVTLSGDLLIVGAPGEASNATGVDGNQASNSSFNSGAAYVFVRSGGTWSQQAYLKASNTGLLDSFGRAVGASGNTVAVGAILEGSNATGVNGNQGNNSAIGSGAVYVFTRSGSTWSQQAYLKASNTGAGNLFGTTVSVSGDSIAVGAPFESSNATGVNGDQNNNSALLSGAAYVFTRSGTTWSQEAYLKASNTGAGDLFGSFVEIADNRLVVGAPSEGSNATGIDGDGTNNGANNSGAAYVFGRSGSAWVQRSYLKASNTGNNDNFGTSVGISGDIVVVGAPSEDGSSQVVNGPDDNEASGAGAAYTFKFILPDLTIVMSHTGTFVQGGGGTYTLQVSNVGDFETSATVSVTDTLPTGLVASSISGLGWTCDLPTLTCTRADTLAPGTSYPNIVLQVTATTNAALGGLNNTATVSGGGEVNLANNTATDATGITAPIQAPSQQLIVSPVGLSFEFSTGAPTLAPKLITVGGEPNITFSAQTFVAWLSVISTGRTVGTVRVTPNPAGLAPGTYSSFVLISGPGGTQYAVDVTLRILPPPELFTSPGSLSFRYKLGDPLPAAQKFYVGLRNGSVNMDYTVAAKDAWVAVTPGNGTTGNLAALISVSANVSGLAAGKYESVVTITAAGALNSPLAIPVTLEVIP